MQPYKVLVWNHDFVNVIPEVIWDVRMGYQVHSMQGHFKILTNFFVQKQKLEEAGIADQKFRSQENHHRRSFKISDERTIVATSKSFRYFVLKRSLSVLAVCDVNFFDQLSLNMIGSEQLNENVKAQLFLNI